MICWLLACAVALQDVEALKKAGNEMMGRQDYKGALLSFEKAVEAAPQQPDLHLGLGKSLFGLKLLEDSIGPLSRALELDPSLGEASYWRGRARSQLGSHAEAIADFDHAVQRGYRDRSIPCWKGYSYNCLHDYAKAEAEYSQVLGWGDRTAGNYDGRAWARAYQGNLKGAISDGTRAIALNPADARLYQRRGIAYYGEDSWENALRDFRMCGELDPLLNEGLAPWIYLSRCRLGQSEEAARELKGFLAKSPPKAGSPEAILARFLLGELPEEALLAAWADGRTGTAQFFIGSRRLIDGKPEQALDAFRKVVPLPGAKGDFHLSLATAELRRRWYAKLEKVVDELEAKLRALPPFEAHYAVEMPSAPEEDLGTVAFDWTLDWSRNESLFVVRTSYAQASRNESTMLHLKEACVSVWDEKKIGTGYWAMDFSFMKPMIEGMNRESARIVPPDPAAKAEEVRLAPQITLNLEAKPSKEEQGMLRFALGTGSRPCSWIKDVPGPDGICSEGKDEVVYEFPARRKKVTIDRKTGLLKSIEVVDYDGTTKRALRLVSTKPITAWPEVRRPAKQRVTPYDLNEFKRQIFQEESLLHDQIAALLEHWDDVVKAGKEDQVAAIVTTWGARHADGVHAYAVRTLAGRRIKEALDLGTPPSTLLQNAEKESKRFAERFSEERKAIRELLQQQLEEFADRTETGLIELLIDSRRHPAMRSLIRAALDADRVEKERHDRYGDRLEELYRQELASRTQL